MNNSNLISRILLPILLVSSGFSIGDELVFKSSDQEHMEGLTKLLNQRGILYELKDGVIRYKSNVKEDFEEAERALDTTSSVQFVESEIRSYFHNILDTGGIEYIELDRDRGTWTVWWPDSEDRKMKILSQVADYKLTLMQKEASDCENESSKKHSNQSPNLDSLKKIGAPINSIAE